MRESYPLTPYQACHLAHDLSRKCAPDDPDRFNTSVFDASIDLNPHQIDAALFALESPFSTGVLLADEVGLGKTVEAGLLLAQRWSEGKRRLLVIAPASLTRQWADELQDKFHLPALVLTSATHAAASPPASASPWASDGVVICSYHFAANREASLRKEFWDLVILDEAHRLRNAYKPSNRIGQTLREVFSGIQKVLLTATPLQNSLMELYGLMSILDSHLFGDADSFKYQYGSKRSDAALRPLAERIAPYCRRTLRRDVTAYIKWTGRKAHLVHFRASPEEQALYDALSDYLAKPTLFAIPKSNRHLMALMLRKLHASSPAALAGTLETLLLTLSTEMAEDAARYRTAQAIADDCDSFSTLLDEWSEEDGNEPERSAGSSMPTVWSKDEECRNLADLIRRARGLTHCTKADALLKALSTAFEVSHAARQRAGQQSMQSKAIIFTESRRTQEYLQSRLKEILPEQHIVMFNGTNDGVQARQVVSAWREARAGTDLVSGTYSVDARAALITYFRTEASVMIATEAAAEGLNLQFCNLVVNFDLPWNPQRIEQRIGRCHRYGQRCDVVVMNFLNDSNAADKRVYELLDTKCRLFEGVFGASDEILGAISSDFNFEKRVAVIYESCRTPDEIDAAFTVLQQDLEDQISHAKHSAVDKLFDRFNPEVTDRVRTDARQRRKRTGKALWHLTKHVLADHATFDDDAQAFSLHTVPDTAPAVPLGRYSLPRSDDATDAHTYRLTHGLASWVLAQGRAIRPAVRQVSLHVSPNQIGEESGWCLCSLLATSGVSASEEVIGVCTGNADWRAIIKSESTVGDPCKIPHDVVTVLTNRMSAVVRQRSAQVGNRNLKWVAREKAKLQAWARDREIAIEKEIERFKQKADVAAIASGSTDGGGTLSARTDAIREEQIVRKKIIELTARLLDTRKKASTEQGNMVMRMLKECDIKTHTSELFVFHWRCVE
jgi:superfamily II DNA or RNA helicase